MLFQQPFLTLACVALLIVVATKPRKNPAIFHDNCIVKNFFCAAIANGGCPCWERTERCGAGVILYIISGE